MPSSTFPKDAVRLQDRQTLAGHSGAAHQFPDEDVLITVPTPRNSQNKKGKPIAKQLPDTSSSNVPVRLVINLALMDDPAKTVYVTDFDPPIELRIHLTADEVKRASTLKLMYWDATNKWTEIPDSWVVTASGRRFSAASSAFKTGDTDIVVLLKHWPSDPGVGVW
jgi:hypothetical protein